MGLVANPTVALACLLSGVLLIYWEINRPGSIVPGALGLLLASYGVFGLSRHRMDGWTLLGLAAWLLVVCLPSSSRRVAVCQAVFGAATLAVVSMHSLLHRSPLQSAILLPIAVAFSFLTSYLLWIAAQARRNKAPHRAFFPSVPTRRSTR